MNIRKFSRINIFYMKKLKKSEVLKEGYEKGLRAALRIIRQQLNESPIIDDDHIKNQEFGDRAIIKLFKSNYWLDRLDRDLEIEVLKNILKNPKGRNLEIKYDGYKKEYSLIISDFYRGREMVLCKFIITSYDGDDFYFQSVLVDEEKETSVYFYDLNPAIILFGEKRCELNRFLDLPSEITNKRLRSAIENVGWDYFEDWFKDMSEGHHFNDEVTITDRGSLEDSKILNNLFNIIDACGEKINVTPLD